MNKKMIIKAIEYAKKAHDGQFRKGGKGIPYIVHPLEVSNIIKERGGSIEEQVAGVLHDVVEDCVGYTLNDISNHFGTPISLLVDYVSESDKSLPWKERKVRYINRLKVANLGAVIVSAGDKLHNLRCTLDDVRTDGKCNWDMFNSSASEQLWFYESLIEIYKDKGLSAYSDEMEVIIDEVKNFV